MSTLSSRRRTLRSIAAARCTRPQRTGGLLAAGNIQLAGKRRTSCGSRLAAGQAGAEPKPWIGRPVATSTRAGKSILGSTFSQDYTSSAAIDHSWPGDVQAAPAAAGEALPANRPRPVFPCRPFNPAARVAYHGSARGQMADRNGSNVPRRAKGGPAAWHCLFLASALLPLFWRCCSVARRWRPLRPPMARRWSSRRQAAREPARRWCWSAATRNTARKKDCRNWPRSWPSITASIAPCCSRSIRPTARSTSTTKNNIPGLEALDKADLMIIATRHRNLPDDQMKHVVDYVASGRPIIGLRTATHAFKIPADRKYARYRQRQPGRGLGRRLRPPGAGRDIGSTTTASTASKARAASSPPARPTIRFCAASTTATSGAPTDVYAVRLPLPEGCTTLVLGQVLEGMEADRQAGRGAKEQSDDAGRLDAGSARPKTASPPAAFTTTMGPSTDLENEGMRRLLVNASYWAVGMEDKIPAEAERRHRRHISSRPSSLRRLAERESSRPIWRTEAESCTGQHD